MMSGFESTSVILTSCQTSSVQCSQFGLPCCHCSAHQTSAEGCLEFTAAQGGCRMFLRLSGRLFPLPQRRLVTNRAALWGLVGVEAAGRGRIGPHQLWVEKEWGPRPAGRWG